MWRRRVGRTTLCGADHQAARAILAPRPQPRRTGRGGMGLGYRRGCGKPQARSRGGVEEPDGTRAKLREQGEAFEAHRVRPGAPCHRAAGGLLLGLGLPHLNPAKVERLLGLSRTRASCTIRATCRPAASRPSSPSPRRSPSPPSFAGNCMLVMSLPASRRRHPLQDPQGVCSVVCRGIRSGGWFRRHTEARGRAGSRTDHGDPGTEPGVSVGKPAIGPGGIPRPCCPSARQGRHGPRSRPCARAALW